MCCDGHCTYVGLLLAAVCTGTSAMAEAARMCNSNIMVLRDDDVSKGRDFMPYRCALLACLLTSHRFVTSSSKFNLKKDVVASCALQGCDHARYWLAGQRLEAGERRS
jgi:hypothetical protein